MLNLKILCYFLSFVLSGHLVYGQIERTKIIDQFDKVDYYPDSTLMGAYKVKSGLYNGYAVEFDSVGVARRIGKYKKGKKEGTWYFSSGAYENYKKGISEGLIAFPGCGTGKTKAEADFLNLYSELINNGE